MKKTRIFYVEDEPGLGRIVSDTLTKLGYDVDWESDGAGVLSYFEKNKPDICVLDIMLPNTDGYSLCRTIRGLFPGLPVIFLTAKTEPAHLVKGFECGGTDYIRKPFTIEELIARIENQLRIIRGKLPKESQLQEKIPIGRFLLDIPKYELVMGNRKIRLSNRDMQVLKMLWANRNGILSRKEFLLEVWGDDSYFNSRNLDVYIRKIRNYFSEDPSIQIITLKGSGYLFIVPADQAD
jgi:DNA-binding response OmpR family regulator